MNTVRRAASEKVKHCNCCGYLENKDERKTEAEFPMQGFVAPDFHAEQGTCTAARKGYAD